MATPSASPRLPAARRRAAILAASLDVFARHGYAGTTTRRLAAASGVTEPVLYRHFASKAALFAALLREVGDRVLERLEGLAADAGDAAGRLAAFARGFPALVAELDLEVRVLNGAAATHADPPALEAVRSTYARVAAFLSRALRQAGLRRGVDPTAAGHLLLEVGVGASLLDPLALPSGRGTAAGPARLGLLVRALAPDAGPRRR